MVSSDTTAQMQVSSGNQAHVNAEGIFNDVFLGNGVEILDVIYEGADDAVGLFENSIEEIGIDRGIVLSTGKVSDIEKNSSFSASSNTSGETISNPDLRNLAGVDIKDIAQFRVKFRPTSDTLRFRYVFASEEYDPQFMCSPQNDAFGFFIQGPNPNGADYNFNNIALIPDTILPVTINTVNSGILPPGRDSTECKRPRGSLDFSQFYNQTDSTGFPVFYGYIDIFVAEAVVVPCEIYTLIIAIADGEDGAADSAVFLEEKSFNTGSLEISVDNPGVDGGISEGCSPGKINISLGNNVTSDFPIEVNPISDNTLPDIAIPDQDYKIEESRIFIPQGQNTTSITLSPMSDNLDEETEYVYLSIRRDICNIDTLIIPIFDNSLDFIDIPDTLYTCFGNPVRIESEIGDDVNVTEPARFANQNTIKISDPNTIITSSIEVSGLPQEYLTPRMISSVCIDTLIHTRLNDLDIYLRAPNGQYLELSTDNGQRANNDAQLDTFINTCFVVDAPNKISLGNPIEGSPMPGNPNYKGEFLPEGDWFSWLSPNISKSNGTYELLIIDDSGEFVGELRSWTITFNSIYEIEFNWFPSEGLNCLTCPSVNAVLENSQHYYLSLTDSYSCSNVDSVWIEVIPEPEQLEITCNAISPSTVDITWTDDPNASYYEFRLQEKFPWLRTDGQNPIFIFGYRIEIISATNIQIQGLLPEEEIDVIVRGVNQNANFDKACLGLQDTVFCTSLPCLNSLPQLDSISIEQPSCSTQSGINVELFATDSNLPLTYRVYSDNYTFENNTGVFMSLPQGDIPIRIINAAGCAIQDTIRIQEPPPVLIGAELTNITCSGNQDGRIEVIVEGNDPPFTYDWNNVVSSDNIVTDLGPNTYTVTVTDSKGCTAEESFLIIDPDPIEYRYVQLDTIDCLEERTAMATLDISGGLSPYNISWDNGRDQDTITGLSAGRIDYTITDQYGCVIIDSAMVIKRTGFDLEHQVSTLDCYSDSTAMATAIASNGIAPYDYNWSNSSQTQSVNNLSAGLNYVTVTDQDGCEEIDTVLVDSPPEIIIQAIIQETSCIGGNDGSLDLIIEGGVGSSYDILWFDNREDSFIDNLSTGEYCVTVTDENNCEESMCFLVPDKEEIKIDPLVEQVTCEDACDGRITLQPNGGSGDFIFSWLGPNSFASNNENIENLCIGLYSLTISERSNRSCQNIFELDIELENNIQVILDPIRLISCYEGSNGVLEAVVDGGAEPYIYDWSDNITRINDDENIASDLSQGMYGVTVTDQNGCTSMASLELLQPDPIDITFSNEDIICYGDSTGIAVANVEGGTPPYLLEWNNAASTDTIRNLKAGNYTLQVIDKNGCDYEATTTVNQPDEAIDLSFEFTEITCAGGDDGKVRIGVENAIEPVEFSLDDSNFKFDSSFINLTSGLYTAYILDGNGCKVAEEFMIPDGDELIVDLGKDTTVRFESDIVLSVLVENNTGDLEFDWNSSILSSFSCTDCPNPLVQNVINTFTATVTVSDESGCTGKDFINVSVIEDNVIQVPTGFTPDGDRINDLLNVFGGPEIEVIKFTVYSQWGNKIYEESNFKTNDINIGWDGTHNGNPVPAGSYVWTAEFLLSSGRKEFASGQTTLIR